MTDCFLEFIELLSGLFLVRAVCIRLHQIDCGKNWRVRRHSICRHGGERNREAYRTGGAVGHDVGAELPVFHEEHVRKGQACM